MKNVLKGVAIFSCLISLTGCSNEIKPSNANESLISFDNTELNISVEDLYNDLKEKYGIGVLVDMIDKKIIDNEYPTDETASKFVNNQVNIYETYYGGSAKFLEALQNAGIASLDKFKESLLIDYKKDLITKEYVKNNITDKEINDYYKNDLFGDITASHILIKLNVTSTSTDEEKAKAEEEAQSKIKEIYEKLNNGEDFHEIAKEYSNDTASSKNGGRLNSFNKGDMDEEFERCAMKLKKGEYNKKVVKTKYGYHIILVEDIKEKASLDTVKQFIIDKLVDKKMNEDTKIQYKAMIEKRKSYGIKINDDTLNTYYDNAVNNWLYGKTN